VDTGAFAADDLDLFGAEAAINLDALSVQSEYMYADVNADDSPGTDSGGGIHAFYIQAGYFLTGESRPYKTSGGVFSRVKPKRNFSLRDGGPGAWELALRYSWLDLDDVMDAGQLDDIVIGLNWYLNPNARMMFDYNHSEADGGAYDDEDADVFALRLQVDF
jgi:phosphate-selective porin OprO/OprP